MVYDVGDLIRLSVELVDLDGFPADPTTLQLLVVRPDQGTDSFIWTPPSPVDLVHPSTGEFYYDYAPAAAGLYRYEFAATGAATADEAGYFEVRQSADDTNLPRLCTVEDLSLFLHLEIPTTAEVLRAIEGATAAVQNYCRQQLVSVANDVVTLRSRGQETLILPEQPVTAVASVVENGVALVNDQDYTWEANGLLWRWSRWWPWSTVTSPSVPGTVVVTYSHGYAVIPQPLREVCIRAASRAYQSGLRTAALSGVPGVQSEALPDYTISYQPDTAAGGASSLGASAAPFLLPSEQAMLAPFRMKP